MMLLSLNLFKCQNLDHCLSDCCKNELYNWNAKAYLNKAGWSTIQDCGIGHKIFGKFETLAKKQDKKSVRSKNSH
jgi:hypothetical protein